MNGPRQRSLRYAALHECIARLAMTPALRPAHTLALATLASLAAHAVFFVIARAVTQLPEVGFEIVTRSEVELGVFDAVANPPSAENAAAASAPTSEPPPSPPVQPAPDPGDRPKPAKPRQPTPIAPEEHGLGALGAFAPKGALLALRLDLDRLRDTALERDAAELLHALPDVRFVLDGSGIEPTRDLSRLLVATPDLQRAHAVIAGRYQGNEQLPRRAVANLAEARGATPDWRKTRGTQVATWHDTDTTPRVLALLGPSLFAITREEDLPRVLGIARSLAARLHVPGAPTQALVHMADDELLSLSIDDARSFVRGAWAQQVPDRLEASVRLPDSEHVRVTAVAHFADAAHTQRAAEFWQRLRNRYASHPLVALIGMAELVRSCNITPRDNALDFDVSMSVSQARLLLGFTRDALGRPALPASSQRAAKPPEQ